MPINIFLLTKDKPEVNLSPEKACFRFFSRSFPTDWEPSNLSWEESSEGSFSFSCKSPLPAGISPKPEGIGNEGIASSQMEFAALICDKSDKKETLLLHRHPLLTLLVLISLKLSLLVNPFSTTGARLLTPPPPFCPQIIKGAKKNISPR